MRAAAERNEPFQLVLTDCNLSEKDGFDLLESIHADAHLANPVIMMLTSSVRPGTHQKCRELGVAARLLKPIQPSEIRKVITSVLSQRLPATVENRSVEVPLPSSFEPAKDGWRVLLAEDHPVNQKTTSRILQEWGHVVQVVENGQEALSAIDDGEFDLVVMDVQMPEMDGPTATAILRDRERSDNTHIPVIAMNSWKLWHDSRWNCRNCFRVSSPISRRPAARQSRELKAIRCTT